MIYVVGFLLTFSFVVSSIALLIQTWEENDKQNQQNKEEEK